MKTAICLIALLMFAMPAGADTVSRTTCSTHTYANGKTKLECVTKTSQAARTPAAPYITLAPLPARPFYSDRRSK